MLDPACVYLDDGVQADHGACCRPIRSMVALALRIMPYRLLMHRPPNCTATLPLQTCHEPSNDKRHIGACKAAASHLAAQLFGEALAQRRGARVQPHDGIVQRHPRVSVPNQRRLPLVCDADGHDLHAGRR